MAEIHDHVSFDPPRHVDDDVILGSMTGRRIALHAHRVTR